MDTGFVKVFRKFLDWEWYEDICARCLFLHMILKANWVDKHWKGIEVKRGQFVSSIKNLSNETGLSEKQVRTTLYKLKKTKEVAVKSTNKYSLYTVVNYETYQEKKSWNGKQEVVQKADCRQPEGKQGATTKKVKNDNKVKKAYASQSFSSFNGNHNNSRNDQIEANKLQLLKELQIESETGKDCRDVGNTSTVL